MLCFDIEATNLGATVPNQRKDDGRPIRIRRRVGSGLVLPATAFSVVLVALCGVMVYIGVRISRADRQSDGMLKWERGTESDVVVGRPLDSEEVYPAVLKSTTLIVGQQGFGSGVLVHASRRLVLTNNHVVESNGSITVFFASSDSKGILKSQPSQYLRVRPDPGISAKVVSQDQLKDLALLELSTLPSDAEPIPLATQPAATGSKLHSIGSSGLNPENLSGTPWRMTSGETRGRNEQNMAARSGGKVGRVNAMLLESQKPNNPGDSGGPTVNAAGGLVGLVCMLDRSRDAVSLDIDLVEIERFLKNYVTQNGWVWNGRRMEMKR